MSQSILRGVGNYAKLALMFGLLSGILVGLGFVIGGTDTAWYFLVLALGMNLLFYFFSDKIVLASTGAKMVSRQEAPQLYATVERVAEKAGIPTPKVGIVQSKQPNAFATGRGPGNSAVVVTTGLMSIADESELEAVIGHEISHVLNRDTLIMTIAVSIATAISYLANMIMYSLFLGGMGRDRDKGGSATAMMGAAMVAPLAATLIQLAISRSREYVADESSARITGKPLALASALMKINDFVKAGAKLNVQPTTSSLWIANPFTAAGILELFSTHPSTANRIRRLQEIAQTLA
jgi:heat shock protein HtpX